MSGGDYLVVCGGRVREGVVVGGEGRDGEADAQAGEVGNRGKGCLRSGNRYGG